MPEYNKRHGWAKGNLFFKEFATELQACFSESLVFRAYGNDFAIISKGHRALDGKTVNSLASIVDTLIEVDVHHIDLSITQAYSIDKLEKMEILPVADGQPLIDDEQAENYS